MTKVSDKQLRSIPGWFFPTDWQLFRFALGESSRQVGTGSLAEIGAYLGKSAVLIGEYVRAGEVFTVLDLFGMPAEDVSNATENDDQYPSLSREKFEENYLKVHNELPVVVQAPSTEITQVAELGAHRFVHVDGSHLYEHVVGDVAASRKLLKDQGIVVFDDYRSAHTPGVSAAVWEAMRDGLNPIALSEMKLYATWGNPQPWAEAISAWLPSTTLEHEVQSIAGRTVHRVWARPNVFVRTLIAINNLRSA